MATAIASNMDAVELMGFLGSEGGKRENSDSKYYEIDIDYM